MHELALLRRRPADFELALARRGAPIDWAAFDALEAERKAAQTRTEALQAQRNQLAREAGQAKRDGDGAAFDTARAKSQALQDELAAVEQRAATLIAEQQAFALRLPNVPHASVPEGTDEAANVELRRWGTPRLAAPEALPDHQTVAERLGGLNLSAAQRLSGARFAVLEGDVARLHRALIQFMLDAHHRAGYREVYVPYLVQASALEGTGQLPKFEEDLFAVQDGLFLIPTAEVPVTNLVADQVLSPQALPQRYVAHTPCFRREAGSAGRDTRGLIRQHQFEKVELVHIETPEASDAAFDALVAQAEAILQALELPYRAVQLCAGDLGFSAERTIDLEVWLPHQQRYREISSCSHFGAFQARRMRTRIDTPAGKVLAHTLNGSGLAVGRTLVAVLETYQETDGSVRVPRVLQPYLGGQTILTPTVTP